MILLSTVHAFDAAAEFAKWLTVAIIAFMIVSAVIIRKRKPESLKKFKDTSLGFVAGYFIGLLSILMMLRIMKLSDKGSIDLSTFLPVVILLGIIILCAIAVIMTAFYRPEKLKITIRISLYVSIGAMVAFLIYKGVDFYLKNDVVIENAERMYIFSALFAAVIIALPFILGKERNCDNAKTVVHAAVCIAMSYTLSFIKLFDLPQGGSVTFVSLLPLMLYSMMFGIRKGVLAGVVYGLLQFLQAPYFLHPVQFLLDYPLAFGAIGLTGLLREKNVWHNKPYSSFSLGAVVAVIFRYIAHVISGIYVFGSGDPENYGAVGWSFLYNAFTFADLALILIVASLLFASKVFLQFYNSHSLGFNDTEYTIT